MKRHLFTLLSVSSLLLCITTAILWLRSYDTWDDLHYRSGINREFRSTAYDICSVHGMLLIGVLSFDHAQDTAKDFEHGFCFHAPTGHERLGSWGWAHLEQMPKYGHHWRGWFGFINKSVGPEHVHVVLIPHAAVVLVSAISPALWLRRRIRRRRNGSLCPSCGYDLRASKDKCPECGNPIPPPSVKTTAP